MIKLENIQKVFRTEEVETVALGDVSFEVRSNAPTLHLVFYYIRASY